MAPEGIEQGVVTTDQVSTRRRGGPKHDPVQWQSRENAQKAIQRLMRKDEFQPGGVNAVISKS